MQFRLGGSGRPQAPQRARAQTLSGTRPAHLSSRLVVPETEKRRVTKLAVARPLGESELGDERRLHPRHAALTRPVGERRAVTDERVEAAHQVVQRLSGEAGADLPRVAKLIARP